MPNRECEPGSSNTFALVIGPVIMSIVSIVRVVTVGVSAHAISMPILPDRVVCDFWQNKWLVYYGR